ncbi:MAG: FMN-binding protein [Deltaproteobacteria bacterium]|nr:FMN-binding protein [Deltaproteobacteria bacterium]MBW2173692.1 FMN-binding protein [Deltaproteobacteria bacterium]MBW2567038.1 FMN-binding protein [Deltaproteobacteria bacterium]
MKEIIKITFALTISCMIAASAMGLTYMVTAKAKKHNHHMNVYNAMVGLLGFGEDNPAPSDLKFLSVYRYIVEDGDKKFLGYMVPVEKGSEEAYEMVLMDLEGNFVEKLEVPISAEKVEEDLDRAKALQEVLAPPKTFSYADSSVVATSGGKRLGYVMPGKFPGFRTFIHALVAMDPKFELLGLEVMEHEEDAGLGKNIEEEYFKNQFKGKTYEKLQTLKVVKKPLPVEYKKYLEESKWEEGMFTEEDIAEIRKQYKDADIYAITASTISSKAVTDGVKILAKKFAYRIGKLDSVLKKEKIHAAF